MTVKQTGLDILDELVMQGATYIDELFKNPNYVRAYKKARKALLAAELERIGEDEVDGQKVLPESESAYYRNQLRATQRAAAREFWGVK